MPYTGESDIMFLKLDDQKSHFSVTGHYPILAGYGKSRNALYVGRTTRQYPGWDAYLCSTDGALATSFSDGFQYQRSNCTDLLVLRHNPSDLLPERVSTIEGAVDPTGPLTWRKFWPEKDPGLRRLFNDKSRSILENLDALLADMKSEERRNR